MISARWRLQVKWVHCLWVPPGRGGGGGCAALLVAMPRWALVLSPAKAPWSRHGSKRLVLASWENPARQDPTLKPEVPRARWPGPTIDITKLEACG